MLIFKTSYGWVLKLEFLLLIYSDSVVFPWLQQLQYLEFKRKPK